MNETRRVGGTVTQTLLAHDLAELQASVSSSLVPAQLVGDGGRFWAALRSARMGDVDVANLDAAAHAVSRDTKQIGRADEQYYRLSYVARGSALFTQDGVSHALRPKDILLFDTNRPYTIEYSSEFGRTNVTFPPRSLGLPGQLIEPLGALRFSGGDGLGAVIGPYLSGLGANIPLLAGQIGRRLIHTALELIATLITQELGSDGGAVGSHDVMMMKIRHYIEENLGSPSLSPSDVATAHHISTRQLHTLFNTRGLTVSSWIRARRLERCRRDLSDPALAELTVGAIGARWGFGDAAHFSRLYKSTFGRSPKHDRRPSAPAPRDPAQ